MKRPLDWTRATEDDFEVIKKLGLGSYSTVWEVKHKVTNKRFAIKHENYIFNDPETCRNILREIGLLRHLQHEGIVNLFDVRTTSFPNYDELLIILDIHATDLKKLIKSTKTIPEAKIKRIMYELLKIVKYLHSAGVLHRDIKPGNILLNEEGRPVLCDFGLARGSINAERFYLARQESIDEANNKNKEENQKDEGEEKETVEEIGTVEETKESGEGENSPTSYCRKERIKYAKDLTGYVATRWYRAPEIILCQADYGPGIDIWGLGCVFAELLSMAKPDVEPKDRTPFFPGSSSYPYSPARSERLKCGISMLETDQLNIVLKMLGAPTKKDCEFIKDERRTKLLMEMHTEKSGLDKRIPSAGKDAIDLLKKMLQFSPILRATVDECLAHPYFTDIRDRKNEAVAPTRIEFDFEAQSYLSKEQLKELIDEELEHFKRLRESNKIMWS